MTEAEMVAHCQRFLSIPTDDTGAPVPRDERRIYVRIYRGATYEKRKLAYDEHVRAVCGETTAEELAEWIAQRVLPLMSEAGPATIWVEACRHGGGMFDRMEPIRVEATGGDTLTVPIDAQLRGGQVIAQANASIAVEALRHGRDVSVASFKTVEAAMNKISELMYKLGRLEGELAAATSFNEARVWGDIAEKIGPAAIAAVERVMMARALGHASKELGPQPEGWTEERALWDLEVVDRALSDLVVVSVQDRSAITPRVQDRARQLWDRVDALKAATGHGA